MRPDLPRPHGDDVTRLNTLTSGLIRTTKHDGSEAHLTLPGAFAALARDEVVSFSALRPHQRHAWHAFLTQVGTLALLRDGNGDMPEDEDTWRSLLRGLTSDHPDDSPWCLLTAADRPALLQPPLPGSDASALRSTIPAPDALDMLIAGRNHDLKDGVMRSAQPDDWLFALLTLQTMEGFLGAGNYGISRMNGGFSNRPGIGVAPSGGLGAHLRRDITRLLAMKGRPPLSQGYADEGGLALLWLRPWDGADAIRRSELDPLYVEICRRVRLVDADGRVVARADTSRAARIVAPEGGVTNDPWTPVLSAKDGLKALTVDRRGFAYRPLVEIMFPTDGKGSPLQKVEDTDAVVGLTLIARALVRGQGKTEGYHERRVPLSRLVKRGFAEAATDPLAQAAHDRVKLAGEMAGVLRFALLCLFENGPEAVDRKADGPNRKAERFSRRFEEHVDENFFVALWTEAEHADPVSSRTEWVRALLRHAATILAEADAAASKASRRRYRARVASESALHGAARRNKSLQGYFQDTHDAAR